MAYYVRQKMSQETKDADAKASGRRSNPLKRLWDVLSMFGGIISLSSLAENWLADAIKWKGWIKQLLASYERIVYPIGEWLLGWLPWSVPTWIFDYFVLGIMFCTSAAKGMAVPCAGESPKTKWRDELKDIPIFILWHFLQLMLWPIFFLIILRNYIYERASDFRDTLLWFAAILLGFVILLAINAAL